MEQNKYLYSEGAGKGSADISFWIALSKDRHRAANDCSAANQMKHDRRQGRQVALDQ